MIIHECEQKSAEWFALRAGRLTGSVASDMLATIKSGEAAARRDLRMRLVVERLTGQAQDDGSGFQSDAMKRGNEMEPVAIAAYEAMTGDLVERVGFVEEGDWLGCSPDGWIHGEDVADDIHVVVSIKCPKSATHLSYLRAGVMPPAYVPQMLHELWITNALAYDFVSFDDRFPLPLQMFYVRTVRDRNIDAAIKDYAEKATAFLKEVENEVQAIRTMTNLTGALVASLEA